MARIHASLHHARPPCKHPPRKGFTNQGIFAIGKHAIESLLVALDNFDAAVFLFTPSDLISIRGNEFEAVRDNVVFELGLFTGRLGRDRTFWIAPHGQTQLRIASDLLGVVPAEYSRPNDDDWAAALSVATDQIHHMLMDSARSRGAHFSPLCQPTTANVLPKLNQVLEGLARTLTSNRPLPPSDGVEALPRGAGFLIHPTNRSKLTVTFGRIEDCSREEVGSVVALPANEFLDDECLTDDRSALGAFVRQCFGDRLSDFQTLVAEQRARLKPALVERETGVYKESYGVGASLYFDRPLGTRCRLILCAVTRKRATEGIKAEPSYVFAGVNAICRIMSDNRLTKLHVPVMGSGHGDMANEVALLCLVLALAATPDIRDANIVVFRRTEADTPELEQETVRKILAYAVR